MKLVAIYRCLCDETRLRILHLLSHRPLCVCHFQNALDLPQVKVSKHLAYLREHEMVETRREGTRVLYSLPSVLSCELRSNLKCLQDCCREKPIFVEDLRRMAKLVCETPSVLGFGDTVSSSGTMMKVGGRRGT